MKTPAEIEKLAKELARGCEREGLTEKEVGALMGAVSRHFHQRHAPGKVLHPEGHMVHAHELPKPALEKHEVGGGLLPSAGSGGPGGGAVIEITADLAPPTTPAGGP